MAELQDVVDLLQNLLYNTSITNRSNGVWWPIYRPTLQWNIGDREPVVQVTWPCRVMTSSLRVVTDHHSNFDWHCGGEATGLECDDTVLNRRNQKSPPFRLIFVLSVFAATAYQ